MIVKHFIHTGSRQRQEDALAISEDQRLFVICDGVGGSLHGDVASKMACNATVRMYEPVKESFKHKDVPKLINKVASILRQEAIIDQQYREMATTIVVVYLKNGKCTIAHMGDSKALIFTHDGSLVYETRDDSLVQDLYEQQIISSEVDILSHPLRNQITKALRANTRYNKREINISPKIRLPEEYLILLGSDGAFEDYTSQRIKEHFSNSDLTLDSRWSLYEQHCKAHSRDNNTAILISSSNL